MHASAPEIIIYGINQHGLQHEIVRAELRNYSDFTIDYDFHSTRNRASWLKRVPESESGAFGMNTRSLEVLATPLRCAIVCLMNKKVPMEWTTCVNG